MSLTAPKRFSIEEIMPFGMRQAVKFDTTKYGMFFEIGPSMTKVVNERLKEPQLIQLFYLFAANHNFQFLDAHRHGFGRDIPTEDYVELMNNISDLRQSVFACFATLCLGPIEEMTSEEVQEKTQTLYEEFDSVNPLEVFSFINYCRQWWDATQVISGFSRSKTRVIYNIRRNYIGLYNPMMSNAKEWWETIHRQGSLEDHTSVSLASAAVSALHLQAHLAEKSELCTLIVENEVSFIRGVAASLERFVKHYCESGGVGHYALIDPCKWQDSEPGYEALVRFIARRGSNEIAIQLAIGAINVDLKLAMPSKEWINLNAADDKKDAQQPA